MIKFGAINGMALCAMLLVLTSTAPIASATTPLVTLKASGDPAVAPLLGQALGTGGWTDALSAQDASFSVNFNATSSSQGILDVLNGKADVAFSSTILTDGEYGISRDLQMLPLVAVPLVNVFNVPQLQVTLKITPSLLAEIWAGNITRWNDPLLIQINDGFSFPNETIRLFLPTGSTKLASLLTALSPAWKARFGANLESDGLAAVVPTIRILADPKATAQMVRATSFSMAFVSLYDAVQNGNSFFAVINKNGYVTLPVPDPAREDMETVAFDARLTTSIAALPGLLTYPILTMVYAVIHLNTSTDCTKTTALYNWIHEVMIDPVMTSVSLKMGFIPLPATISTLVLNKLSGGLMCEGHALRSDVVVYGGGSTQTGSLLDNLVSSYSALHQDHVQMNYLRIGSIEGINRIKSQRIHFAVSDINLAESDFASSPLQVIPMYVSAASLIFNLPGMTQGVTMKWSREVVVGVFNGTVYKWNDPLIVTLNPFIAFPDVNITLVTITGTSSLVRMFKLTMASFNPKWGTDNDISSNPLWNNRTTSRMKKASSHTAVATTVQSTAYSVAFVPQTTVVQLNLELRTISIPNRRGNYVLPSVETITVASDAAVFDARFQTDIIDTLADSSYPITAFSSFVLPGKIVASDCRAYQEALQFVLWASETPSVLAMARTVGYVPAFSGQSDKLRLALSTITCNGVALQPLPSAGSSSSTLTLIIAVCVGVGTLLLFGTAFLFVFRAMRRRLQLIKSRLNDVETAAELSEAIATFDLDKMTFLEDIAEPTKTQKSCLKILHSMKLIRRYIPQALLQQLQDDEFDGEMSKDSITDEEAAFVMASARAGSNVPTARRRGSEGSKPGSTRNRLRSITSHGSSMKSGSAPTFPLSPKALSATEHGSSLPGALTPKSLMNGGVRALPAKQYNAANNKLRSNATPSVLGSDKGVVTAEIVFAKRAITVLCLRITNFYEMFKADPQVFLRVYNGFLEEAYTLINQRRGTVATMDGEYIVVHWNAARKSASARVQACEVASLLASAAGTRKMRVQVGICHDTAAYTSIGGDSMSSLVVLGAILHQARLLQRMNEFYGTSILVDESVKRGGCEDALFLLDHVAVKRATATTGARTDGATSPAAPAPPPPPPLPMGLATAAGGEPLTAIIKVYELIPQCLVTSTDFDDEWLYAFKSEAPSGVEQHVPSYVLWSQAIEAFYAGELTKAQLGFSQWMGRRNGTAAVTGYPATFLKFAQQLLDLSGGRIQFDQLQDCSEETPAPKNAKTTSDPSSQSPKNAKRRLAHMVDESLAFILESLPVSGGAI